MKKLLAIALLALPVVGVACTETVVKKAPGEVTPTPETDGGATVDPDAAPAGDPCACPKTCQSETEADKKAVCKPAPAPDTIEEGTAIGKFQIRGSEYWQWKKADVYGGGKNLAWGYNGDGADATKPPVLPTEPSRACMAEAFKVLQNILTNDVPPELEAFRVKHKVTAFWGWNNDMTDTKPGVEATDDYQSLWLFNGNLIKWVSHTNRDGTCRLPTREDLVKLSKGCMDAFPDCYNARF